MVTKPHTNSTDERIDLARAIHQLKIVHGPRITAHLLYHAASSLTREADRLAEAERNEKHAG
jgi:hypothetical protein